jgi:HYDIN/CFA65/VesB family protein/centrosomal CEP192-like protein/parallel beta helix pectate lyase-like protein
MTPIVVKIGRFTSTFMVGLLALFTPLAGLRAQQTINVPANQPTIQAAINAANNGDTVLVSPGTYSEKINFNGKAITVTSSGGPSMTIIDGGANGSVVTFTTGETTSSTLSGFTIRNGQSNFNTPGVGSGGGILISSASPTIRGNVITGNQAVEGIGISINGGSPVIQNNVITGNTQCCGTSGGGGGGIHASASFGTNDASPLISGNTITNNSVNGGGFGGGILVDYYSTPTIQGNLIAGNSAYNSGGGVTLRTNGTGVTFVQNIIVNNSSQGGGSGGGLYLQGTSYTIVANTIAQNSAFDKTSGVFAWVFGPSFAFTDNVVVAASGQTAVTCYNANTTFIPTFSFNDVYSASGQAWSGVCDSTSLPGNISADPLFLNAANSDFHLTQGSPAIDVGDNSAPNLPQTDFDGNPRIVDGNNDGISTVDLGAYEFGATVPPAVSLSPSTLTFPSQLVGTSSQAQTVTLTNTGGSSLSITSISSDVPFSQSNNCAPTLSSGSSCTISVVFSPIFRGVAIRALTISDNASGSPHMVGLSGTGIGPVASFSPTSLVFPPQIAGTVSASQTITVSNVGDAPLTINSITTQGDFVFNSGCGTSLNVGASCTINVSFAPSSFGNRTGLLAISESADAFPQNLGLTGTGVDFYINVIPNSVSLLRGTSFNFTVSLTPLGGTFGNSVALSCSGLPSMSTCSFSPGSVIPGSSGASSSMTISTDQSDTQIGNFVVTITGQSGTLSHSTQIQLTIFKFKRH